VNADDGHEIHHLTFIVSYVATTTCYSVSVDDGDEIHHLHYFICSQHNMFNFAVNADVYGIMPMSLAPIITRYKFILEEYFPCQYSVTCNSIMYL